MIGTVSLPGGIYLGEELHTEVELRETSGVEEDILISPKRDKKNKLVKSFPRRLTEVLALCTVRIGSHTAEENRDPETASLKPFLKAWEGALAGDRAYALLSLRRLSLGDVYKYSAQCPVKSCSSRLDNLSHDLSQLTPELYFSGDCPKPAEPDEDSDADPSEYEAACIEVERQRLALVKGMATNGSASLTLPSGRVIDWKLIQGVDEEPLGDLLEKEEDNLASALLRVRLLKINGEEATLKKVKYLPSGDRNFLNEYFDKQEGGFDTRLEIECTECGHQFMRPLAVGDPGFFFRSGSR